MTNTPGQQEALQAVARLNLARAELEETAPADAVERYTVALIDAAREVQRPMWGPGYVDPDPSRSGPRAEAGQDR